MYVFYSESRRCIYKYENNMLKWFSDTRSENNVTDREIKSRRIIPLTLNNLLLYYGNFIDYSDDNIPYINDFLKQYIGK